MLDVIAFDADDTLWDNEHLYIAAKQEWVQLLSECADPAYCAERLEALESINVQYYGYGIKSFVLSMIEAALELTEKRVAAEKIGAILSFAKHMLAAEVTLIDGAAQTLAALKPRYRLMLITKGEASEQMGKIERSGLAHFFDWVEIVPNKTPAIYQNILTRYNLAPERFLMVGNSLRSDILPVLAIGGQAVLVPYAHTWAHEMDADPSGHPNFATLERLEQVVAHVARLDEAGKG